MKKKIWNTIPKWLKVMAVTGLCAAGILWGGIGGNALVSAVSDPNVQEGVFTTAPTEITVSVELTTI
ncbi:MAG: hypothetical protein NC078_04310, partial [Ruminococcus sp.]|nr:hypothetical protein [Ruminococcus sp.]